MAWNTRKHGKCGTRIYRTYSHMKERCTHKGMAKGYLYYEKGIRVCEEWLGEKGFEHFQEWAMLNGYADDLTLDRIDGNKGYSPDNCRWVSYKVQNNNTSRNHLITHNGETHTIAEWADIVDIPYNTLNGRLFRGIPFEVAISKKRFKHGELTSYLAF